MLQRLVRKAGNQNYLLCKPTVLAICKLSTNLKKSPSARSRCRISANTASHCSYDPREENHQMIETTLYKYLLVGMLNTTLHLLIVFMLNQTLEFSFVFSNITAFNLCIATSYLVNAKFTFKKKLLLSDFLKYLTITITGSVFLSMFAALLTYMHFNFWTSQLGLQLILSIFVYILIKKIVFRKTVE